MDAAAWDMRYNETELVWSAGPNQLLADEVTDLAPGRALDVASGEGRNAIWLASKGWVVTAVDFSAVATRKGERLMAERGRDLPGRIEWVCDDVRTYEPARRSFDLVVIAYLHLGADEFEAVLIRAASAVAPGGWLLVVGHHLANLTEGVGGPQDPEILYGPDDIVGHVSHDGGLVVERAERVNRPTDHGDAIDVVVRLRRVDSEAVP